MNSEKAAGGVDVALEDVSFSFGEVAMRFDLAVPPASITAVMGPSGSGKSTLLNLIAGFETPASGRVFIGKRDVTCLPPSARPVSMVFQENNLFAHLSVEANVGLGVSPSLRLSTDDRAAIAEAVRRIGLAGKEKRLPHELSGGERQRVALARVLVRNRPVLLLDEPFASLGPALRAEMLDLLLALQADRRPTVLLVTHHPEDARRIAGRIVFVEDGKVAASGDAAEFFGKSGPAAFLRYIGENKQSHEITRKRT